MTAGGRPQDDALRRDAARVTGDGYDRIGPFHPVLVWVGVALFDLSVVALLVTLLLAGVDWTEDLIWPGGPEMLPF